MSKNRSHSSYVKKHPDELVEYDLGMGKVKLTREQWKYLNFLVCGKFNKFRELFRSYE